MTGEIRCENCLVTHGFSSGERRSIIVMVVLTGLALIACFVGILWFTIRTRFLPEKSVNVIVQRNDVFQPDEDAPEDYMQPTTTTTLPLERDMDLAVRTEVNSV